MSMVFLWFGITQAFSPGFMVAYLPQFARSMPIDPFTLVRLNGIFEIILGTPLIVGFQTRASALLLSIHLLLISFSVGIAEIGIRDFGLASATLAIFLNGPDYLSLDKYQKTHSNHK